MEVSTVLFEMGLSCLVLFFGGLLAKKANLSLIPLYIVTGLVLSRFFKPTIIMEFMSTLGLILLLFLIGLEFTLESFLKNRKKILTGGLYDLALNFPVGLVIGLLLGFDWLCSLFLAGIVYVSSSAIICKGIIELKRSANPETECLLGILVFEDLFIVLYLAILSGIIKHGSPELFPLGVAILKAVGFCAVIIIIARVFKKYIERVLDIESTELFVLLLFGIVILTATSAEALGLSIAIGAFLAGLLISETNQKSRAVEVVAPFQYLTAAIFFVSFGLTSQLTNVKETYPLALILVGASIPLKLLTGFLASQGYNLSTRAKLRLGLSLLPRGEFSVVLATVAMNIAKIHPVGAITTLYVLIIAILGSIAMKYADVFAKWVEGKKTV
ncbi:MAG TPA: cation:proton antiporter [Candidatus Hypogeohydataceae bacterium YC41]